MLRNAAHDRLRASETESRFLGLLGRLGEPEAEARDTTVAVRGPRDTTDGRGLAIFLYVHHHVQNPVLQHLFLRGVGAEDHPIPCDNRNPKKLRALLVQWGRCLQKEQRRFLRFFLNLLLPCFHGRGVFQLDLPRVRGGAEEPHYRKRAPVLARAL